MGSLRHDKTAKFLYFGIRKGKVAEKKPLNSSVFMNLDGDDRWIVVEFVLPKKLSHEIVSRSVKRS